MAGMVTPRDALIVFVALLFLGWRIWVNRRGEE